MARTLKFHVNGTERPMWLVERVFGEFAVNALRIGASNAGSYTNTFFDADGKPASIRAEYVVEQDPTGDFDIDEFTEHMRAAMYY